MSTKNVNKVTYGGETLVDLSADKGYGCLSQVTVRVIPYVGIENSADDITVTIAG